LYLSVASVWEMQIKSQLGKLKLNTPLDELVRRQQEVNGVELLPVLLDHVLTLRDLPSHHRDPFDRLLIAQTVVENATLVTHDPLVAKYPVRVVF
ncbi:MAG: type II toxin-antitoxin system VapC family toxin, partial [Planctomycetes bacterium]|nr:type II toxin-antitoxin system VapC family toxin [Planctomycetota bacterium]